MKLKQDLVKRLAGGELYICFCENKDSLLELGYLLSVAFPKDHANALPRDLLYGKDIHNNTKWAAYPHVPAGSTGIYLCDFFKREHNNCN